MSSTLIQRRVAAVASPRSPLAAATARRHLYRNQLDVHHYRQQQQQQQRQQQQHQTVSRGLTHRLAGGGTSPKEQTQLQSPVHPQNPKHLGHHQKDYHHAHHRHQQHPQQQIRRPSTSQAQLPVAADSSYLNTFGDASRYSEMASQQVFHHAAEEHHLEWVVPEPSPEMRVRTMVKRFGERYFVDELPSRTRKSVADAAAAGKGHITAEDITRVLETISDGKHIVTEEEARGICEAWGTPRSAGEGWITGGIHGGHSGGDAIAAVAAAVDHHAGERGGSKSSAQAGKIGGPEAGPAAPGPTIPKDVFLQLLAPPLGH